MAYDRYIDKAGRLYIVLHRFHSVSVANGKVYSYPTNVEVLKVIDQETVTVPHKDFEERITNGALKLITNKT